MNLEKLNQWAKEEFIKIANDIPELKGNAYLVFSSSAGQCKLTANRIEIYRAFPEFFVKNDHHDKIDELLKTKDEGKILKELLETLLISQDVLIEFRFEKMNSKLIEFLKKHPKVKQPHNMMRSAWIRVILISVKDALQDDC